MKLTPKQIDHLYQFTRQHYVEYYDLQTELVDHLANAIEEQWKENPKLSFEDALQAEFKKFGIFGFTDVVEKRKGALRKKYNYLVWHHLKTFYSIPKVFATLISIVMVFKVLENFNAIEDFILYVIFGLYLLFFLGLIIRSIKKQKQFKLTGKKWLFDKIIVGFNFFFIISYILHQAVFRFFSGANRSDFVLWLGSVIIVSFILIGFIVLFLIPSKAEEYLKQTYPEYELAKNP